VLGGSPQDNNRGDTEGIDLGTPTATSVPLKQIAGQALARKRTFWAARAMSSVS
jgi:hypothetical protein